MLSGGGARGAYEVGVLRYIRERLRGDNRIDIITGSSIGAINGAYIAATADRPKAQGRLLARVWSELNLDEVCKFGWPQMRALPQVLFGKFLQAFGISEERFRPFFEVIVLKNDRSVFTNPNHPKNSSGYRVSLSGL